MRKIKISNVKNIKSLEFTIPNPGVYVLTGSNGSGKTTLLTALHRIGYSNAFANSFKTTANDNKLDFFGDSSISYFVNNKKVSYRYGNTRWAPTPRKNNKILEEFKFPQVRFIAADAKRIEATEDELRANRINTVRESISSDIKLILANEKFGNLKYINTKRGLGNRAYLVSRKIKGKNYYFSEKNFSLGELCVLRLVVNLSDIHNNSLVLIDEIEMALHPKAQAALFNYLLRVADDKKLTVIFSTHSASLIKRATPKRILLLKEKDEGIIECLDKVYPAQALGDIAYDDEISPDFLFFVEDYMAKIFLEQMIDKYKSIVSDSIIHPYYKVVPVGGFKETIEFLTNSDQIFGDEVRRYAFLDEDVKKESIEEAKQYEKYEFLQKVKNNKEKIKYLPCTPEEGIIDLLESNILEHSDKIKSLFGEHNVDISRIMDSEEYRNINKKNQEKKLSNSYRILSVIYLGVQGSPLNSVKRHLLIIILIVNSVNPITLKVFLVQYLVQNRRPNKAFKPMQKSGTAKFNRLYAMYCLTSSGTFSRNTTNMPLGSLRGVKAKPKFTGLKEKTSSPG